MELKKGLLKVFIFFIFFNLIISFVSALGASPAVKKYNFKPGLEAIIHYSVFGSDSELEIFAEGDLAEYVTFDKTKLDGGGEFTATLKLPDFIEKPGRHIIFIGISEVPDKELASGIGTTVGVHPGIFIYVPFPGKYLDVFLESKNANVGELIEFNLDINSLGTEDLTISPIIEIFDSKGSKIETLNFKEREIPSMGSLKLRKELDTTGYNPGEYKAVAIVDYGKIAEAEVDFKIGELVIGILNYTTQVDIGKIAPFYVEVQSGWNENIDGVYGDISFYNGSEILTNFRTSTETLVPWENKTLVGHFDTLDFSEGYYKTNITLFYYGKNTGSSTSKMVQVLFIKERHIMLWIVIGGVGLLIIIVLSILKFIRKNGKKKK